VRLCLKGKKKTNTLGFHLYLKLLKSEIENRMVVMKSYMERVRVNRYRVSVLTGKTIVLEICFTTM
jgi:hypothetical protein